MFGGISFGGGFGILGASARFFVQDFSEVVAISEQRKTALVRLASDNLALADSSEQSRSKAFFDGLLFVEAKSFKMGRNLGDVQELIESFASTRKVSLQLLDLDAMADLHEVFRTKIGNFADGVVLEDSRRWLIAANFAELAGLSEKVSKLVDVVVGETVILVDSSENSTIRIKELGFLDVVVLVDSVAKESVVELDDSFNLQVFGERPRKYQDPKR